MGKKAKLLLKSFFVFGFGGVLNKAIPLVMVPIVTRLLPDTSSYGLSDLCSTIVSFGGAVAMVGMYDALTRLFFESEEIEYRKRICSTAITITTIASLVIFLLILLGYRYIADYVFKDATYWYLVFIAAVGVLFNPAHSLMAVPTRMLDQKKTFLLISILSTAIAYALAICFILFGKYIIGIPLGTVLSIILVVIAYGVINKEWFSFRDYDRSLVHPLLKIGLPLLPTFLIYWIFDSCDKIMISRFLGVGQVGIYAVGAKLGRCSQLIYMAFTGGWQYFAYSTMKDENQVCTNSKIFEYFFLISVCTGIIICGISKPLFGILFTGEYVEGYIVAPYLYMAPLVQVLFVISSNQFIIEKKTWPIPVVLGLGALLNVILNYLLIPIMGIEGAAIASLVGYVIATVLSVVFLAMNDRMVITYRIVITSIIMLLFFLVVRTVREWNEWGIFAVSLFVSSAILLIYHRDLKTIIRCMGITNH